MADGRCIYRVGLNWP